MATLSPWQVVWRSMVRPFRFEDREQVYLGLLAKLALLALLYPFLDVRPVGNWLWLSAFWFSLLGAVHVVAEHPALRRVAVGLLASAILAKLVLEGATFSGQEQPTFLHDAVALVASAAYVVFIALVGRVIFVDVYARGRVDTNRILGAICLYVLLGIGFAYLFAMIEVASSDPTLRANGEPIPAGDVLSETLYFSFVTLTTVGYGDIAPDSDLTRVIAGVEAMTGQVYLTVLVARLVGLHVSQASAAERQRVPD